MPSKIHVNIGDVEGDISIVRSLTVPQKPAECFTHHLNFFHQQSRIPVLTEIGDIMNSPTSYVKRMENTLQASNVLRIERRKHLIEFSEHLVMGKETARKALKMGMEIEQARSGHRYVTKKELLDIYKKYFGGPEEYIGLNNLLLVDWGISFDGEGELRSYGWDRDKLIIKEVARIGHEDYRTIESSNLRSIDHIKNDCGYPRKESYLKKLGFNI